MVKKINYFFVISQHKLDYEKQFKGMVVMLFMCLSNLLAAAKNLAYGWLKQRARSDIKFPSQPYRITHHLPAGQHRLHGSKCFAKLGVVYE